MNASRALLTGLLVVCLGAVWAGAGDGQALVEQTCARCHDLKRVERAMGFKDRDAWSATVARMLAKPNAPAVSHEEHGMIVDWLASQKK